MATQPRAGSQIYGDGTNSTVGPQFYTFKYLKQATIEAVKKQFFGQMSGVISQPKHFGKTMKKFLYVPILDDRNSNDQGIDASGVAYADGNLYGSSKDIGVMSAKMPVLSEEGGRVNRVGMTRLELQGSIENFGIFEEWTRDTMNFDNDDQLMTHLHREAGRAAGELNEDKLAIDLYNACGVIIYAGGGSDLATTTKPCEYDELELMEKTLTENYCPFDTQIITGSRNIDTATVSGSRYAHCSIDSRLSLQRMKDPFGEKAWTPARQYAAGGTLAIGEKGAIETTRFIEVPEMPTTLGGTSGTEVIHPILFVGSGSFTQIGFQTNGKNVKLEIITKKPSKETADKTDPYGKVGFTSINWWSGVLIERPEWLGKILHDPAVAHA
jgi:N4-gp56 family major capsid protein